MTRWWSSAIRFAAPGAVVVAAAAFIVRPAAPRTEPSSLADDLVARGRYLVVSGACGDCHGGGNNPAAKGWLTGGVQWHMGPCFATPGATPCFITWPHNLTPDAATGLGRFSERQIFNALRYGLRMEDTPDLEITSTTPGQGNFPLHPHYVAPPMPWPVFRHMPDQDLRAIAAYLHRALKPVVNKVAESEGPPDFWASAYTTDLIGPAPAAAFPTANEVAPAAASPQTSDSVARGRFLIITHGCGDCHGGSGNPAAAGWLAGATNPMMEFHMGPCFVTAGATPCFVTRPRNLTPDNTTGLGRYSERQIFNALRYGLRIEDTPDVAITGTTPGQGNYPLHPRYLAPPMPWPAWRHMPDGDLWAIAAYLHRAVKPVANKVADSEGPPDFWASSYTVDQIGSYPAPAFPTANEQQP